MSKNTRSISLPSRTVLGGGMKGKVVTRGMTGSVKGKGCQRGRDKQNEIEVRCIFYDSIIIDSFKKTTNVTLSNKLILTK